MSIEKIERLIEKLTKPHTQMHRSGHRVEKSPPSIQREAASTVRALLDELSRLREALEPFARADRAIGDELGPFRFETERGYRLVEREHFRAAARALSEREGQDG
jgi:hypothetical protein